VNNHHPDLIPKLISRNHSVYELRVYKAPTSGTTKKRLLFKMRCSLHLLPCSLAQLGKEICPDLEGKGFIEHDKVTTTTIKSRQKDYVQYMKNDVKLLGAIMVRAQKFFYDDYHIDVVDKTTIAALSLSIFRMHFFDDKKSKLYIPTKEEDKFFRDAYYGGHVDVYKPRGKNLKYYDVNSLYPFIMKTCKMPGGKPVKHDDLRAMKLDDMFGFIWALVRTPTSEKRPFLPFRDPEKGVLVFGTGYTIGCFFTEELKHAKTLGYDVYPLCGYLFDAIESPFSQFVDCLYSKRLEAKAAKQLATSYLLKLIMNSLYGRLAIGTESTKTIICTKIETSDYMMKFQANGSLINVDQVGNNATLITYKDNVYDEIDGWAPPINSAPQCAASVTSYGRIHMHQFINRDDCYYTDTDSVVLKNELPEELISDKELGKLKREYGNIRQGIFIAPKCYYMEVESGGEISMEVESGSEVKKFKGVPRRVVKLSHYENIVNDPTYSEKVEYEKNFSVNWEKLRIEKRTSEYTLSLSNKKRIPVIRNGKWVDTEPHEYTKKELTSSLAHFPGLSDLVLGLWDTNKELQDQIDRQGITNVVDSVSNKNDSVSNEKSELQDKSEKIVKESSKNQKSVKGSKKKGSRK
jgi:hypothetical protein